MGLAQDASGKTIGPTLSADNPSSNIADEIPQEYTWDEGIPGYEPDIVIPKSLGAKAKNFDVLVPNGDILHLTEGTRKKIRRPSRGMVETGRSMSLTA